MNTFNCNLCGWNTWDLNGGEYYMVKFEIWSDFAKDFQCLCIGCLESKLTRKLNKNDFLDVPINKIDKFSINGKMSDRLIDRLSN